MICRRGVFLSFMMMMILNEWSRVLRIAADRLRRDLTATRRRFGIKSKVRFAALLIVVFLWNYAKKYCLGVRGL